MGRLRVPVEAHLARLRLQSRGKILKVSRDGRWNLI